MDIRKELVRITEELQPKEIYDLIRTDYDATIDMISHAGGFGDHYPIQPVERLPKEYEGIPTRHNGTHPFLIDDFCRAYDTGKLSPINIWEVTRWNIPGLMAHQSALEGGKTMDVIDLGEPPADWKFLIGNKNS